MSVAARGSARWRRRGPRNGGPPPRGRPGAGAAPPAVEAGYPRRAGVRTRRGPARTCKRCGAAGATGEFQHVARRRAQAERGTVDQAELATLLLSHRTALALLQGFGEEENGRERRAQVVRELHDEIEPVGAGQ